MRFTTVLCCGVWDVWDVCVCVCVCMRPSSASPHSVRVSVQTVWRREVGMRDRGEHFKIYDEQQYLQNNKINGMKQTRMVMVTRSGCDPRGQLRQQSEVD